MTPNNQVWTQEEREEAARQMYIRKFREDVPDESWLAGWARDYDSDASRSIDVMCELNAANHELAARDEAIAEARELLKETWEDLKPYPNLQLQWVKNQQAWLSRNPERERK